MKTSFGVYVLFFDISAAERIKLFSTTRLHIKEKIKIKLLFFFSVSVILFVEGRFKLRRHSNYHSIFRLKRKRKFLNYTEY